MCDDGKNLILDKLYLSHEEKLIPECDGSGNIEYKLRLDKKNKEGRDKMVSQMLWRMNEGRNQFGRYEAHYILGIHDDGRFSDMNENDLYVTTNIFRGVVKRANAKIVSEKIYVFAGNKMITHLIIKKDHRERHIPELNIMIMGPSDSGKSSMMGKLTYGQKDDGNGFSRKLILRHAHERTSGTTSCPKYDTIGFVGSNVMNYSIGIDFNMENIYNTSDRMINLIDMPGDMKYVKTILYSISSLNPNHIILCIPFKQNFNGKEIQVMKINDVINQNKDYYMFIISLCIAYKIDPIIVLTKCDLLHDRVASSDYVHTIGTIFNQWKINFTNESSSNAAVELWGDFDTSCNCKNDIDFLKCSYVDVSNITNETYDNLIYTLGELKAKKNNSNEKEKLFIINDVFTIPDIGQIFHGTLKYGVINVDDVVTVLCHGQMFKKQIKSIHRKTLDVEKLLPDESGSVTFYGKIDKNLDKTASVIDDSWISKLVINTKIKSVFSTIKLKPQQYMLFVNNSILTVIIGEPENDIHILSSVNNVKFILDTNIGTLKDDQNNYYFINFV